MVFHFFMGECQFLTPHPLILALCVSNPKESNFR